jgi:hypothetical protein
MRTFVSIALNAFMELVRQPIFLLLMTTSAGFCVFIAAVPYFGFGEDPKLVKDMSLALMLLSGLFGAVPAPPPASPKKSASEPPSPSSPNPSAAGPS